jgi:hypothetical protein
MLPVVSLSSQAIKSALAGSYLLKYGSRMLLIDVLFLPALCSAFVCTAVLESLSALSPNIYRDKL